MEALIKGKRVIAYGDSYWSDLAGVTLVGRDFNLDESLGDVCAKSMKKEAGKYNDIKKAIRARFIPGHSRCEVPSVSLVCEFIEKSLKKP